MRNLILRTAALGTLLLPATALAQVANPLPQAAAMGNNYTALARGLAAPAWNPAGLGMPDSPALSFTLMPFGVNAGLGPITLSDLADYEGVLIPRDTRIDWLDRITAEGGEKGAIDADVTFLAVSVGPVAFSASSSVRGKVNMAPDFAEVFFFGNAGLTGDPRSYTLSGSNFDVAATTTFAASVGMPLGLTLGPMPDQQFAVGATLTYTVGNFLALGQERESYFGTDPLEVNVRFPMVNTPLPDASLDRKFADVINNGSGVGIDVGAAWQGGIFAAGVVVKNLINTFEWDLSNLEYREGTAVWNADTAYTAFAEASIDLAPSDVTDRLGSLYAFSPTLAAGVAAEVLPILTVTGDVRHALDENLTVGAQSHVGVGAELTALAFLPLRAGVAVESGGYRLSGGLGLKLGPVQLAAAGAYRNTDLGSDAVGTFGFTYGLP